MAGDSHDRPADVLVVGGSLGQREGLFGFLTVAFALALFRGLAGAQTSGGRIAVGVFAGGLLVLVVGLWLSCVLRPTVLEVSSERIHLVNRGKRRSPDLAKSQGSEVGFYTRRSGRYSTLVLRQSSTRTSVSLPLFSRASVAKACRARGWDVLERSRHRRH